MSATFPNALSEFVYTRTYSRWLEEQGRRENWEETVTRLVNFYKEITSNKLTQKNYEDIHDFVINFKSMPSMRLLWTAGEAVKRSGVAAFNCSYLTMDKISSFSEMFYILLVGCGVGYSVESKFVEKLPEIKHANNQSKNIVFEDSKEGWAKGLLECCEAWWDGFDVTWDLSGIRKRGSKLKTFGGRASGPEPLNSCLLYFKNMLVRHRGRKLSSLNVSDLSNMIAQSVVVGGVRRSSQISLSDLYDQGMRNAKQGQFWINEPQRSMSNNSAVYDHKPSSVEFMKEWISLAESGTGERGIFNRSNLKELLPKRRSKTKKILESMGVNPCSEIILRDRGLCNLTEVVVRAEDDINTVMEKIKIATIMGTIQSMITNYGYLHELNPDWKKNAEEERLLGVSLTGQMDNPKLLTPENLQMFRDYAIGINAEYSQKLGINRSAAVTAVKPSGTVSQLVDSASGFHPRFSKYYIRRVRISSSDPLFKMMRDQGVKFNPEVGQSEYDANTWVCSFPIKAPENAITVDDVTAIEQLDQWLKLKQNFTEHTVSATIYVADDEWLKVGSWVYEHFDDVTGLSFLPKTNHIYELAPYEKIDEKTYNKLKQEEVIIDYSKLSNYEKDDEGEGAFAKSCEGDKCEITRK